jgi:serine/threonine protein kinase
MKRKAAPQPSSSSSSRAARTGRAQVGLHESAGSLDELYETVGVIGRGSFAEINLLKKREGGELFALKTCCKLDALSYAHLRKEAVLMKPLRHAFLLTPVEVVDSRGRAASFSVLLELCPGGDLLQLLRRQPEARLQPAAAARYCAMIVLGLGALHEAGLAYRDLKPENLFLRANGYLRLADFGLAAPLAECDTTQVRRTARCHAQAGCYYGPAGDAALIERHSLSQERQTLQAPIDTPPVPRARA